jgi:hypothetical protein
MGKSVVIVLIVIVASAAVIAAVKWLWPSMVDRRPKLRSDFPEDRRGGMRARHARSGQEVDDVAPVLKW